MTYKVKYRLGQKVKVVHDPEGLERMITQVFISPTGIRYSLSCGDKETVHYEMELMAVEGPKRVAGFKVETP
jgi:hypothetical protein